MNKKGITMVTVVVMIIIMLIIATVSIIAGNEIIVNSNQYKIEQEIQSVKAAVLRKKAEVNMAGTLVPIGESYVGQVDPILKSEAAETISAIGWYLLDEESLEKLGVYDATSRYLVNYNYEAVIPTKNTDYIEEYMVVESLHNFIAQSTYPGTALKNKIGADTSGKMMKNKKTGDVYGTGWYILTKGTDGSTGDFQAEYAPYIQNDYLFNFETARYIKITSSFEEV